MVRASGLLLIALLVGCDESSGGTAGTGSGSTVAEVPKNPGGGFSADLSAKLAGGGSDKERTNTKGSAEEMKGSDAKGSAETGSAGSGSGSAETKIETQGSAGSADPKAGSAKPPEVKPPEVKPPEVKSPEVKPPEVKPPEVKPPEVKPPEVKPPDKQGSAVSTQPKVGSDVTAPKTPVVLTAELKSINISLLPNWDRDVAGAGTISLAVKVPNKTDIATFVFHYGVEPEKAPADRDAYKKWLADQKIFTTKDDRQKGGAWYLEGTDSAGRAAFRMVVIYGGRKVFCGGPLYRDSALGDLRDQTVIQAKQICETVAL